MSLIISEEVRESVVTSIYIEGVPIFPSLEDKGATVFYVVVRSEYLSSPYKLETGDTVLGTVISIGPSIWKEKTEEYSEFEGKGIHFILRRIVFGMEDWLHIKKDDWIEFREYGLVTPGYILELELKKAIKSSGEEIALYTKKGIDLRR